MSPNDCLSPPPDGTPDREQYDRFADFLRFKATGPAEPGKPGRVLLTEETYRYALGEDVAPTAVDEEHPGTHSMLRQRLA